MRINTIVTRTGENVGLGQVTVLVGPNNSGKSRTLMDIRDIFERGNAPTVLIERLVFEDISFEDFRRGLNIRENPGNNQHIATGLSTSLKDPQSASFHLTQLQNNVQVINQQGWQGIVGMGVGHLKLTLLNSELRLQLASQQEIRGATETARNPLEMLYENYEVEDQLNNAFKNAFASEIRLDHYHVGQLLFRIAPTFPQLSSERREARRQIEDFARLDDQGDGFKSFVGIILGIILSEGRIVLIDEPEAFLHPTQARVLGEWVATYSRTSDTQLIIATHSADILDGLLQGIHQDEDQEEEKQEDEDQGIIILRVDRRDDVTRYHLIDSQTTEELGHMPLISSQPVLESIFYRGVIVTEGDQDRAIYKAVYSQNFSTREHLFVNAIGKQSIKKIISPVKSAQIPMCAIVDIDIINNESIFKELIHPFLENEEDLESCLEVRKQISDSVEGVEQSQILTEMKAQVETLSNKMNSEELDLEDARREINKIHEKSSKWNNIKKKGIEGIPNDVKEKTKTLLNDLKKIGVFVVPVGELESWISVENILWIDGASDVILQGNTPENLKSFVKELIDYLEDRNQT